MQTFRGILKEMGAMSIEAGRALGESHQTDQLAL